MFKIKYLPAAKQDLKDITRYISVELGAPKAAERLVNKIDDKVEKLLQFPRMYKKYIPVKELSDTYRVILVNNFLVFYVILEKHIEIRRVIYAKRDIDAILEETDE